MKVYIEERIDYTLKRRGDRQYSIVDENGKYVNRGGCWKTKKACMDRLNEMGHEYGGTRTVHQNYSHWAEFTPAKLDGYDGKEVEKVAIDVQIPKEAVGVVYKALLEEAYRSDYMHDQLVQLAETIRKKAKEV